MIFWITTDRQTRDSLSLTPAELTGGGKMRYSPKKLCVRWRRRGECLVFLAEPGAVQGGSFPGGQRDLGLTCGKRRCPSAVASCRSRSRSSPGDPGALQGIPGPLEGIPQPAEGLTAA